MRPRTAGLALWALVVGAGCTSLVGLDNVNYTSGAGGSGATGGTTSSTGGGMPTGGAGGTTTSMTSMGGGGTTSSSGGAGTAGAGGCVAQSDGNDCTVDTCDPDVGMLHTPSPPGTQCNQNGGKVCGASGACVQCAKDDDCGPQEACDTPTGACLAITPCGDGAVGGGEQCDDGNAANGDGCSAGCNVEAYYQCNGAPSKCVKQEVLCNDGLDNDGDGKLDAGDPDCATPLFVMPCSPGRLHVYKALGLPAGIPNDSSAGVTSRIVVADGPKISRPSLTFNVTHTRDSDLTFSFSGPGGFTSVLCAKRGGDGDNFTDTVIDPTCGANIASGVAPFSGCYKPESANGNIQGMNANGDWTLKIVDDSDPFTGTLSAWTFIICAQ